MAGGPHLARACIRGDYALVALEPHAPQLFCPVRQL